MDVADYVDLIEARREEAEAKEAELWDAMHLPAIGCVKVSQGAEPEQVADDIYPEMRSNGDTEQDAASAVDAGLMPFEEWWEAYGDSIG